MAGRNRLRVPNVVAAIAAGVAFALAVALVVWLFFSKQPRPPEPPSVEIEARGPKPEPIVLPAPAKTAGPVRVGVASVEKRVTAGLAGKIPTAPYEGPLRVRVLDIVWDDPAGRPFLQADSVRGVLDGGALNAGNIVITEATLTRPALTLERGPGERQWNYEAVLARLRGGAGARPLAPAGDDPDRVVRLRDVEIDGGQVVVHPPGPKSYRLRDIDAYLPRVAVSVPEGPPRAEIMRLKATADIPEIPEPLAVAVDSADVRFPDGRIAVDVERLAVGRSVVRRIAAEYVPSAPGLGLKAAATVERLDFADVRYFVHRIPPEGTAKFALEVEPLADGRTELRARDLVVETDQSMVTGAVAVEVGAAAGVQILAVDLRLEPLTLATLERFTGPLPYSGALRGTIRGEAGQFVFDVTGRLVSPAVAEPFTAQLVGRVALAKTGLALRSLEVELRDVPLAALRAVAPALPLAPEARVTGRLSFEGPPGRVPLSISVSLGIAGGTVEVNGTLDLTGAVPAYDLSGRVVGVRLPALLEPAVPPVAVTASFSLVGSGTAPATADARLSLRGRFTGWRAGPADTLLVRAAVSGGMLRLDAASLRLATLSIEAAGTWRWIAPESGGLEYRVALASVDPFAPYLHFAAARRVRGAVRTSGRLMGTLQHPRLAGTLEGDALGYGAWTAGRVDVEYDVGFGAPLPRLDVTLRARDLVAPGNVAYDSVAMDLLLEEPTFSVTARAERLDGGVIELAADGRVVPHGPAQAVLRRLAFDLAGRRWSLARAARIEWIPGDGVVVSDFVVREVQGEGRIAVDGRLPPTETTSLHVEVAALPVGEVQTLLGIETPYVTGVLWVDARALGPPESPRVGVNFRLEGGKVNTTFLTRVEGGLLYESRRLTAEAVATLDTLGAVELTASLPVSLELALVPRVGWVDGQPLRATLRADSLPLSALTMITRDVRDAKGTMHVQVQVSGTPQNATLGGTIQVANGAVTVRALDRRYDRIRADIVLEDRRAIIRELSARSDGQATVTGSVAFEALTKPVVDLVATFDGFRAVGAKERKPAAVSGTLRMAGDLSAPVISGDVTLDDGDVLVPSFQRGAVPGEVSGVEQSLLEPTAGVGQSAPAPWFERVALDSVGVDAGNDLWFATNEARAQLSGELVLDKVAGESLRVSGELSGDRGTFILRVGPLIRRFDIVSARIRFFGTPEPNPAIDITASRVVPNATGEPVEIRLVIGGTVNAPTVDVTTAEGAHVPESELLSFLLFGQPSFALGQAGAAFQPLLAEALFGVGSLAELASIGLEEALITNLGLPLDYLMIRPTPGPVAGLGAPTIAFGRELAHNVFLTVNAELAGVFGTATGPATWSATIHWRIDPEWSLEIGIAPVYSSRVYPWFGTAVPGVLPSRQFLIELVRRWTY